MREDFQTVGASYTLLFLCSFNNKVHLYKFTLCVVFPTVVDPNYAVTVTVPFDLLGWLLRSRSVAEKVLLANNSVTGSTEETKDKWVVVFAPSGSCLKQITMSGGISPVILIIRTQCLQFSKTSCADQLFIAKNTQNLWDFG